MRSYYAFANILTISDQKYSSTARPMQPIINPAVKILMSSTIIDMQITTTPNDGSVSSPENGGARVALMINKIKTKPITNTKDLLPSPLNLLFENFSAFFIKPIKRGRNFSVIVWPSSVLPQDFGTQIDPRLIIICAHKIKARPSNMYVTPPVGRGSAVGSKSNINDTA